MTKSIILRSKTKLEELADTLTHGIGLLLSVIALCLLIYKASTLENKWVFISFSIYGISLVSAYLSSTIYHLYNFCHTVPNKIFKRYLLLFDHCSIFFLIAGTYSPILLNFMRTTLGKTLFLLIWILTFSGIIYKIYFIGKFKRFSIFMYTCMGWLIIFSIQELLTYVPHKLLYLLFTGGIFYSIGIIFYVKKFLKFNHAIWHILVLIGSIIQFIGIFFFTTEPSLFTS